MDARSVAKFIIDRIHEAACGFQCRYIEAINVIHVSGRDLGFIDLGNRLFEHMPFSNIQVSCLNNNLNVAYRDANYDYYRTRFTETVTRDLTEDIQATYIPMELKEEQLIIIDYKPVIIKNPAYVVRHMRPGFVNKFIYYDVNAHELASDCYCSITCQPALLHFSNVTLVRVKKRTYIINGRCEYSGRGDEILIEGKPHYIIREQNWHSHCTTSGKDFAHLSCLEPYNINGRLTFPEEGKVIYTVDNLLIDSFPEIRHIYKFEDTVIGFDVHNEYRELNYRRIGSGSRTKTAPRNVVNDSTDLTK